MAVFTLPPEVVQLYKPHIEYLTEHAVDPDKRRYSTVHEAIRHYIDLDHFGTLPFENVPRSRMQAMQKFCTVTFIHEVTQDTLWIDGHKWAESQEDGKRLVSAHHNSLGQLQVDGYAYRQIFYDRLMPYQYEQPWTVPCVHLDSLSSTLNGCWTASVADSLSPHGILPYHLVRQQRDLTEAFSSQNLKRILRLSADMGHYLADAHVPLHTTTNYNGQLTDQLGIHAFWESRIPELFAEAEFDFFVGKAVYIPDPQEYFWDIVLESHSYVDSVLSIEKQISLDFAQDQKFCFSERNKLTVRTQCEAYARAYQDRMEGMVEQRMQESILSIGSAWYTAWVDAGQPDLKRLVQTQMRVPSDEEMESNYQKRRIKGREHN